MNHAEIVAAVAKESGQHQTVIKKVLEAIQTVVKAEVAKGEEVRLTGLFTLKVEQKAARTARNPATGAQIAVPAKRAVKIKATKELTDAANAAVPTE